MSRSRFTQLVTELSSHAGLAPMVSVVLSVGQTAYASKDSVFPRPGSPTLGNVDAICSEIPTVVDMDLGEILRRGVQSSEELDLLAAITLLGVVASWPNEPTQRVLLVRRLLWLETHSGLRCLSSASAVLDGARLSELAASMVSLLRESDIDPDMIQVMRAWLKACDALECAAIVAQIGDQAAVSSRGGVVDGGNVDLAEGLSGNLGPRPRHAAVVALMALSTLLFFSRLGRGIGQLTLGYRCTAKLVLSGTGLELTTKQVLLGRVLKERKYFVPLHEIRQVLREVRYPRLGLYAGLAALTLGTLLGTRVFVDGLRVAGMSFAMMAWGALFILVGLGLDWYLTGPGDRSKGRCRLIVRTRGSGSFSLGSLDPTQVDALLYRWRDTWSAH